MDDDANDEQALESRARLDIFSRRLVLLGVVFAIVYAAAGVAAWTWRLVATGAAIGVFALVVYRARTLLARSETRKAALLVAYALVGIASVGVVLFQASAVFDILVCNMAIAATLTQLRDRDLRRVTRVAIVASAGIAGTSIFGPPDAPMPLWLRAVVIISSTTAATYLIVLLLQQHSENLRHLLDRSEGRMRQLTRLQAELVRSERLLALGEAAAVVAHEVRNPLCVIVNAIGLIRKDSVSEHSRQLLALQEEEAFRLDRLVSDMLVLAKPIEPQFTALDVERLLKRCVESLASVAEEAGVKVDIVTDDATIWADNDYAQLATVNVLRNAISVSPREGTVRVRAARCREGVRIAVEDEGEGLPPESVGRIFEPFFTTKRSGSGLGLAIVDRVMKVHGGTVRALDAEIGHGARFELLFVSPPATA